MNPENTADLYDFVFQWLKHFFHALHSFKQDPLIVFLSLSTKDEKPRSMESIKRGSYISYLTPETSAYKNQVATEK